MKFVENFVKSVLGSYESPQGIFLKNKVLGLNQPYLIGSLILKVGPTVKKLLVMFPRGSYGTNVAYLRTCILTRPAYVLNLVAIRQKFNPRALTLPQGTLADTKRLEMKVPADTIKYRLQNENWSCRKNIEFAN